MPPRAPTRNPYPIPDISTEGFWRPGGPVLGKNVSLQDRDWATRLKTHERLFAHHTLTSIRRDHRLVRPKVANDSLDIALSATYIHDEDTMVPKEYVPMQPETLNWNTWKVLRNELRPISFPKYTKSQGRTPADGKGKTSTKTSAKSKISGTARGKTAGRTAGTDTGSGKKRRVPNAQDDIVDKEHRRLTYAAQMMAIERIHPSSLKLAIEGPHTDQTNPGYSRKIDGTFYSI